MPKWRGRRDEERERWERERGGLPCHVPESRTIYPGKKRGRTCVCVCAYWWGLTLLDKREEKTPKNPKAHVQEKKANVMIPRPSSAQLLRRVKRRGIFVVKPNFQLIRVLKSCSSFWRLQSCAKPCPKIPAKCGAFFLRLPFGHKPTSLPFRDKGQPPNHPPTGDTLTRNSPSSSSTLTWTGKGRGKKEGGDFYATEEAAQPKQSICIRRYTGALLLWQIKCEVKSYFFCVMAHICSIIFHGR